LLLCAGALVQAASPKVPVLRLSSDAGSFDLVQRLGPSLSAQLLGFATLQWRSSDLGAFDLTLDLKEEPGALVLTIADVNGKQRCARRIDGSVGALREFELGAVVRAELSAMAARDLGQIRRVVQQPIPSSARAVPAVEALSSSSESGPALENRSAPPLLPRDDTSAPTSKQQVPVERETDAGVAEVPPALTQRSSPLMPGPSEWRWRLGAGYNGRWLGPSFAWSHGLGAQLQVRLWRGLFVGLQYGFSPLEVTSIPNVTLMLSRHEVLLAIGFDVLFGGFSVTPELAVAAASTSRKTTSVAETLASAPEQAATSGLAAIRGHLRTWLPFFPRLQLDLAPTLEFAFGETRYVVIFNQQLNAAEPAWLRPRLDVAVVFHFQ
jgi:hypothetical protein